MKTFFYDPTQISIHHVQGNTAIQVHPWKKCQFRFIQMTNPVQNGGKWRFRPDFQQHHVQGNTSIDVFFMGELELKYSPVHGVGEGMTVLGRNKRFWTGLVICMNLNWRFSNGWTWIEVFPCTWWYRPNRHNFVLVRQKIIPRIYNTKIMTLHYWNKSWVHMSQKQEIWQIFTCMV